MAEAIKIGGAGGKLKDSVINEYFSESADIPANCFVEIKSILEDITKIDNAPATNYDSNLFAFKLSDNYFICFFKRRSALQYVVYKEESDNSLSIVVNVTEVISDSQIGGNTSRNVKVIQITSNKYLFLYTYTNVFGVIININSDYTFTLGTKLQINTSSISSNSYSGLDAVLLGSSKILLVYDYKKTSSDIGYLSYNVLDVSSSNITILQTFNENVKVNPYGIISICKIDDATFYVFHCDAESKSLGRTQNFALDVLKVTLGTNYSITLGVRTVLWDYYYAALYITSVKIDDTHILVQFLNPNKESGAISNTYVGLAICTITETSIIIGTPLMLADMQANCSWGATSLDFQLAQLNNSETLALGSRTNAIISHFYRIYCDIKNNTITQLFGNDGLTIGSSSIVIYDKSLSMIFTVPTGISYSTYIAYYYFRFKQKVVETTYSLSKIFSVTKTKCTTNKAGKVYVPN